MTDTQFLGYCEIHCTASSALFSQEEVNRLHSLAGEPTIIWKPYHRLWHSLGREDVEPLVQKARLRISALPPTSSP